MRASGEGEVYVPDPEAAQIVRTIFLYAAGGDTTMQIAGKLNAESEYVKIKGHHESFVAEELFREAQNAIKVRKKREAYKKEENPSPLKGKVKCGCCGYGMSFKRTVKKQYYYCRMGSGYGSYLKIGQEPSEKTV